MAVSMFTTDNYTEAIRLAAIRDLSGNIKVQTKSNDIIIEIASRKDQMVFDATDTTSTSFDDTTPDTPLVIDASNCYTAAEILRSFGTVQNDQLATTLTEKADGIVEQINGESAIQKTPSVRKTQGVDGDNDGTFN